METHSVVDSLPSHHRDEAFETLALSFAAGPMAQVDKRGVGEKIFEAVEKKMAKTGEEMSVATAEAKKKRDEIKKMRENNKKVRSEMVGDGSGSGSAGGVLLRPHVPPPGSVQNGVEEVPIISGAFVPPPPPVGRGGIFVPDQQKEKDVQPPPKQRRSPTTKSSSSSSSSSFSPSSSSSSFSPSSSSSSSSASTPPSRKSRPTRKSPPPAAAARPATPPSDTEETKEKNEMINPMDGLRVAIAQYSYVAQEEGELAFEEGEEIVVTAEDESGWGMGYVSGSSGARGVFPLNYISPPEENHGKVHF